MRRWWWTVVLLVIAAGLVSPRPAQAVPSFARREGLSCQVCHFRMPELNTTGQEFLRRGLRMPGVEEPAPRALGEPLPLEVGKYLSIMGEHNAVFAKDAEAEINAGEIDLWLGGPLTPKWSALANPIFDIDGGGSSVDVGYAHGITGNGDRVGSARFGQVQPFAILFNQGGPSLPLSAPVVLEASATTGNVWTPTTLVRGGEVGLITPTRWTAYLGVGQPHLEDFEGERHTDVYASVAKQFPSQPLTLTGYGYWGKASLPPDDEEPFHRLGLFAHWLEGQNLADFGFLTGSDDLPGGGSVDSSGWFLIGEHLLSDRWAAYARWDHLRQDLPAGGHQTINGPALGVSWWLATEVKVGAEAQFLHTTGEPSARSLTLDLLWIF